MNFTTYQEEANRTSGARGEQTVSRLVCAGLGAAGEAGELANKIKKKVYHLHADMDDGIAEEIGDVLWYLAEVCNAFGWDMEAIAQENLDKLSKRYPDGFTVEDSINRN